MACRAVLVKFLAFLRSSCKWFLKGTCMPLSGHRLSRHLSFIWKWNVPQSLENYATSVLSQSQFRMQRASMTLFLKQTCMHMCLHRCLIGRGKGHGIYAAEAVLTIETTFYLKRHLYWECNYWQNLIKFEKRSINQQNGLILPCLSTATYGLLWAVCLLICRLPLIHLSIVNSWFCQDRINFFGFGTFGSA